MDVISFFYCTMMEKKNFKKAKNNWIPFSLYLSLSVSRSWHRRCLSLSFLPLPTFDERVEKKNLTFFSWARCCKLCYIPVCMLHMFISYTSLDLRSNAVGSWVQTDPGPTRSPSLHLRPAVPVCHGKQCGPGTRSVWLSMESAGPEDAQ